MARGITWDTPRQAEAQSDIKWQAKHAPGPPIRECCECGAQTFPQWHDGREVFCARCVPDELRYPERKPR